MAVCEVGALREHALVAGHSLAGPFERFEHQPEIELADAVLRRDGECLTVSGLGLFVGAGHPQHVAEVVMRIDVLRPLGRSGFQRLQRTLMVAQVKRGDSGEIESIRVVRLALQDLPAKTSGFLRSVCIEMAHCFAEVPGDLCLCQGIGKRGFSGTLLLFGEPPPFAAVHAPSPGWISSGPDGPTPSITTRSPSSRARPSAIRRRQRG